MEAERLYRELLGHTPDAVVASNLGALLRSQGRLQEAAAHYHRWIGVLPYDRTLSLNAANCFRELGSFDAASALLHQGLIATPNDSALLHSQAETLLGKGELQQCHQLLLKVVAQEPNFMEAWASLGVCAAKQADLVTALRAFERAHGLDPANSRIASNRITVLKDMGRLEEAQRLWEQLDAAAQGGLGARAALAGLRMAQLRYDEASQLLAALASEEPQQPLHWLNWAACLRALNFTVAPCKILQRGLQWAPLQITLQQALAQGLAEMGQHRATVRLMALMDKQNDEPSDIALFSQQFIGMATGLIAAEARAQTAHTWEQKHQRQGLGRLWPDHLLEPLADRRLRVGYLSADCANHPVARFLLPILHHHNREAVEVWVLSGGPHQDWITDQLRQACDHWIDLDRSSPLQAARVIADQRLDVLVELGGFTSHSKLDLLVHRPAPVQLSYLGYPAPTYLEAVDGWIGDQVLFGNLNPVDQQAHPLLSVDGGYMVFDPGGDIPIGKRSGGNRFRFGSFNHARKLTDATIALFCDVMEAVPDAELVLKSINFHEEAERQRVQARFEAGGLAAERLVMLGWVEGGLNHLMRYGEMDVALDPVPYGGATTTAEALWMGVPVVALAGEGMVGRLAASLLVHGGLDDWVAADAEEYVAIAKTLARAGPRKRKQRQALRKHLKTSALTDGRRLSRELERIYQEQRQAIKGA